MKTKPHTPTKMYAGKYVQLHYWYMHMQTYKKES